VLKWAAVATWFITIDGGLALLVFWLRAGGLRRSNRRGPRIGPELIATHFSLAGTSFALWIVYLAHGGRGYAVAALCLLVPVATLGFTMLGIWLVHRLVLPPPPSERPQASRPVDQRLPITIIVLHGLFAAATLVLVALVVITT
jgi:hypothetical protein